MTAREAPLCTSVNATTGRPGRVLDGPGERRPAKLGRIAAARAGVAHRPAELEHRLAVEVETSEATAPDERPVRPVTGHPFADPSAVHRAAMSAAHVSTAARVQGPVQYATTGPLYNRSRSLTSSGPTGVRTSRGVSIGSVGAWAGRLACI
jgi:hypothetical protein